MGEESGEGQERDKTKKIGERRKAVGREWGKGRAKRDQIDSLLPLRLARLVILLILVLLQRFVCVWARAYVCAPHRRA
jgi:hypothetical protein